MTPGESNGHVTGDVTWPWKVKVMTQIYVDAIISKTVGDRDSVQWDTNRKWRGESIGHVTDDVTWPWKVKVVTPISWRPIIWKRWEARWLEVDVINERLSKWDPQKIIGAKNWKIAIGAYSLELITSQRKKISACLKRLWNRKKVAYNTGVCSLVSGGK